MPRYAYQAIDKTGKTRRGTGEAANEHALFSQLQREGLHLVSCREEGAGGGSAGAEILLEDQLLLCRHLRVMVGAGVPVHQALSDVTGAVGKGRLAAHLPEISGAVVRGESLSAAFEGQGARFDPLFVLLFRAGEKTGRLHEALRQLEESLTWKKEYARKLRGALAYPAIQMALAVVAVLVLMLFAVPQIEELLKALGEALPLYAQILLFTMKLLGGAFVVLAALGFLFFALYPLLRRMHDDVAVKLDALLLRLPVLGPLFSKLALAQLTHLFAAMLASGIPAMEVLKLLPGFTANRALAAEFQAIRERVESGQALSQAFSRHGRIPRYVIRLIKMGEDGGRLQESLRYISDGYADEGRRAIDSFIKIMSLFITLAVGFVLIAMVVGVLYPLYQGLGRLVAS